MTLTQGFNSASAYLVLLGGQTFTTGFPSNDVADITTSNTDGQHFVITVTLTSAATGSGSVVVPFLAIGAYDTYDAFVLSNSPTHYWPLADSSTPAVDLAGGVNLPQVGTPTRLTGVLHRRL